MPLTVVMYHYVRRLDQSRFPAIKGLETEKFKQQVRYIKQNYTVISGEELLAAAEAGALKSLPENAALLTFDDGYIDHYTDVLPVLLDNGISGCFFVPAGPVFERHVLDVNKLHFVLAAVTDARVIADYLLEIVDRYADQYGLQDRRYYWNKLAVPKRFDGAAVVFVKKMLQRELPLELRQQVTDELFRRHVSCDEQSFASELYLDVQKIREMREAGMSIGGHGYTHCWLDSIDAARQEHELEMSLELLRRTGTRTDTWMMCYPYGAYDTSLLHLLQTKRCTVGFTTQPAVVDLDRDNLLTLPRLDTNDVSVS